MAPSGRPGTYTNTPNCPTNWFTVSDLITTNHSGLSVTLNCSNSGTAKIVFNQKWQHTCDTNTETATTNVYVHFVAVEFAKDTNQIYGYDKYEAMNMVYNKSDPTNTPGPPNDFVSVEKDATTTVRVTIHGCDPTNIFFTSEDETIFKPDALHVAASPGILQLDGKSQNKAMTNLCARIGSESGPISAQLGVCVYKKIVTRRCEVQALQCLG